MRVRRSYHRMSKTGLAIAACLGISAVLWAQGRGGAVPQPPPPNASTDPLLRGFTFRSIGPATMMGRIDDIQGSEKDPMIVYVGFATGGLWKSTDGGIYWKSQLDNMANESVGAIGIAPSNPEIVYVGTGEANNRQSSSIGDGVWGTTDGGKTWNHLGLEDTQSIGRVVVDPTDPNIGLCGGGRPPVRTRTPNAVSINRTDGGKTWKKSKYIDPDTGFIDVAIDPSNPKILYATSYQRRRTWWGFNGGGPGSGLWKTTDAGDTWTKLEGPGWPKPKDGIYGRIAISIYRANPKIIYAQVEAGASGGVGAGTAADDGLAQVGRDGGGNFGGGETAPGEAPNGTAAGGCPAGGTRGGGGGGGRGGRGTPPPPDPNSSGVFRSEDGGMTWTFMSNQNQRPMYFSQIRVDPVNDQEALRRRHARPDVARWRQDVERHQRLPYRLPRLLDQPQGLRAGLHRP